MLTAACGRAGIPDAVRRRVGLHCPRCCRQPARMAPRLHRALDLSRLLPRAFDAGFVHERMHSLPHVKYIRTQLWTCLGCSLARTLAGLKKISTHTPVTVASITVAGLLGLMGASGLDESYLSCWVAVFGLYEAAALVALQAESRHLAAVPPHDTSLPGLVSLILNLCAAGCTCVWRERVVCCGSA